MRKEEKSVRVSVIVPFFNEMAALSRCLDSLLNQEGESYEIILVDDGSGDRSEEVAATYATRHGNIRLLNQQHEGPGRARNLAALKAKGDILVFVDADMVAGNFFLKKIIRPIVEQGEDGTFVLDEMVLNFENRWSELWSLAHGLDPKRRIPKDFCDRANTYRAVRKDAFLKCGGNQEKRGVSEDELDTDRIKPALGVRGAVLWHENPGSVTDVFRSARWFGRGRASNESKRCALLALFLRYSLPKSLLMGIYGTIKHRRADFLLFKIFFDISVTIGAVNFLTSGKRFK